MLSSKQSDREGVTPAPDSRILRSVLMWTEICAHQHTIAPAVLAACSPCTCGLLDQAVRT